MRIRNLVMLVLTASPRPIQAQSSAAVVGGGYAAPAPLTVGPGQLITIFVSGIGSKITQRLAATSYPLPTELGGISVSLSQLYPPQRLPIPLLAVFPFNACTNFVECSNFLGITLQIPFELVPNNPAVLGALPNAAEVTASDGTITAAGIQLNPVINQIHVLRYGDMIALGSSGTPIVTHLDGALVSRDNPARVGEIVVLYAVGLGRTDPAVKTGDPSPSPPLADKWPLIFDYRPNATPSAILIDSPASGGQGMVRATSLFTGLTPGYAGLYQTNFQVPAPPGSVTPCGDGVRSNLTVNLIGTTAFTNSFDGAAICVASGTAVNAEFPKAKAFERELPELAMPRTKAFSPRADSKRLGQ